MTSLVGSFLLSDSLDSSGVVGQEESALTGYQFQSRYQSVTEEARLVRNDVSLEQGIGDGGWEPSCQRPRPQPRLTSWALHCRVMMRHWNRVVGVSGKIQLFNPASSCKRLTVNGEKAGAHAGLSNSGSQGRYLLDLSKALSCNASCSLVPIDSEIGDDYQVFDLCQGSYKCPQAHGTLQGLTYGLARGLSCFMHRNRIRISWYRG